MSFGERTENLNLENGEVLEGVSKFCYLDDMLNGEGGSSLALISRVRYDWKKFRELSGILTSKSKIEVERESLWGMCLKYNDIWK